jgi:hypothetical protein
VDVVPVVLVLALDVFGRLHPAISDTVADEGTGRDGNDVKQVIDLLARAQRHDRRRHGKRGGCKENRDDEAHQACPKASSRRPKEQSDSSFSVVNHKEMAAFIAP